MRANVLPDWNLAAALWQRLPGILRFESEPGSARLRPGWTPKHSHLSALRRMEKAFLRDLWIAWRRALNMPVVPSYFPDCDFCSARSCVNRCLCLLRHPINPSVTVSVAAQSGE